MQAEKKHYGTLPNGETAEIYTLDNGILRTEILTLGATLQSLFVPDKNGVQADVLLGFDTLEDRLQYSDYQGESVGRYANRIANACFDLDGKTYHVTANENGETCLHGGGAFSRTVWDVVQCDAASVQLRHVSPDGADGFPGCVSAMVHYELKDRSLFVTYTAETNQTTVINMTNHAYFNLAAAGDVLNHVLQINAEHFLPIDAKSIPTGELRPVADTAFDFRTPKPIGRDIGQNDPQLVQCKGYDHNFCVTPSTSDPIATVIDPKSGREMRVYTNQVGVQLYTANFLDAVGKNGARQTRHSGFCLETQCYPDTPNHPAFPSCALRPDQLYVAITQFAF
ncbi:MAG: galactose mutarotase [Oscillospiraceae bacterium]|jgi:aldose 1-epimerase|nr:galactose mutarotase [Oscillospiraceae bacterium]